MVRYLVKDESEGTWKEAVLFKHLSGGNEHKHETRLSGLSVFGPTIR